MNLDANKQELSVGDVVLVPCVVLSLASGKQRNMIVRTLAEKPEHVAQEFAVNCTQTALATAKG